MSASGSCHVSLYSPRISLLLASSCSHAAEYPVDGEGNIRKNGQREKAGYMRGRER